MALKKMMLQKQQPCSKTGRSWILPQLHKIHSKNKGERGREGKRRKGHKEGRRRSQNGSKRDVFGRKYWERRCVRCIFCSTPSKVAGGCDCSGCYGREVAFESDSTEDFKWRGWQKWPHGEGSDREKHVKEDGREGRG